MIGFFEDEKHYNFSKEKEIYLKTSLNGLIEANEFLFPAIIYFQRVGGKYSDSLSNHCLSQFIYQEKEWKTVQHFLEASKFRGTIYEEEIRIALTPEDAIELSRHLKQHINPSFKKKRNKIMLRGLYEKFIQNEELQYELLSTGNSPLVFQDKNSYWGNGKDKEGNEGKNFLGRILVDCRDKIRNEKKLLPTKNNKK